MPQQTRTAGTLFASHAWIAPGLRYHRQIRTLAHALGGVGSIAARRNSTFSARFSQFPPAPAFPAVPHIRATSVTTLTLSGGAVMQQSPNYLDGMHVPRPSSNRTLSHVYVYGAMAQMTTPRRYRKNPITAVTSSTGCSRMPRCTHIKYASRRTP